MKIDKKYLSDWINKQLPNINTEVHLKDISFINRNSPACKGFVYKILIMLQTKSGHPIYIYSYFSMKELTEHIQTGKYELYWKFRGYGKWIRDSEITLKEIA